MAGLTAAPSRALPDLPANALHFPFRKCLQATHQPGHGFIAINGNRLLLSENLGLNLDSLSVSHDRGTWPFEEALTPRLF
ncbi:MAG: hypothetical protein ACTSUE_20910 [Promethearchaeota archaeon]